MSKPRGGSTKVLKEKIMPMKIVAKRITIMLDDELVKKLHDIQAKQIKETNDSISFSQVLNEALKEHLKKK